MTINHERRSRLLRLKIKQQSWDIEDLKKQNRSAKDDLERASDKLGETENVIDETEQTIRQTFVGQVKMDLSAIDMARQFLAEQQEVRIRRTEEQQKAISHVDQAESHLKQTALFVKALEQIKSTSDKEIGRVQENQMSEQLAELWRQRYGRNK